MEEAKRFGKPASSCAAGQLENVPLRLVDVKSWLGDAQFKILVRDRHIAAQAKEIAQLREELGRR